MEDEIVSVFYRIYNSFSSTENSIENKRAFDCLPFTSEINLQRLKFQFLRILNLRYVVLLNELHRELNFFLIQLIF